MVGEIGRILVRRREILRQLKPITKVNVLKISVANSFEHESRKFEIAYWCKKNGYMFVSEAEFLDGKRADIVVLDRGMVIEIETDKNNWKNKENQYIYPYIEYVIIVDPNKTFLSQNLI